MDFDLAVEGDVTALDVELCALPMNDLGNAIRLERRFPDLIWWTTEWGVGVWDGRRFDFERGQAAVGLMAQQVARLMLSAEAPAFQQTQRRSGERPKDFEARAAQFRRFALQAGDNSRTEAMLKQAARRRTRPLADFDADPEQIVVANGVLKLPRDGTRFAFTPGHDPRNLNTRVAKAKYDPTATAPIFEQFLRRVQPDPEVRAFLARVAGSCLTGYNEDQAFFLFQGKGGDGKSTFLTALESALGGYVANADISTFLRQNRKGSDHSADLARLASGSRLVKAAEPEQGATFAESTLKSVTGGEPIVARAMYLTPFEYTPVWKLIVSCNRKPRIRGDDRGIWRRIQVVPWPVSLPDEDIDKRFGAKLALECDGILNWMLCGWEDWVERGLAPPEAVLQAVQEYQLQSNPFIVWCDRCCEFDDRGREPSKHLYDSYCGYVAEMGSQPMTRSAFGRALGDRGLHHKHSNGAHWLGVRLNAEGEAAIKKVIAESGR